MMNDECDELTNRCEYPTPFRDESMKAVIFLISLCGPTTTDES
jgi:hypothetical protein